MLFRLFKMIKRAFFSEQLAVGQVWHCEARPQDTNATITILKIDEKDSDKIVSIRIDGISLKNPTSKDGFSNFIQHVPIAETALRYCLTGLKASNSEVTEEMLEGYNMWKQEFSIGKARYFETPLAEIIGNIENILSASTQNIDQ